jgi:FtsH-binding integral membrane protein
MKIKNVMPRVFMWLFIGLLITFGTGFVVSMNPTMISNIFGGIARYIILIATLGVGLLLGVRLWKMKTSTAICLFILYTFLTGLTFSIYFVLYKITFLMTIFLVAASLFGVFAVLGKIIKFDLSKFTTYLLMGLIGIIVLNIINIFIPFGSTLNLILAIVGLIVFLGYTAIDIQRITKMMPTEETLDKLAIIGAFSLYIDYISVVIDLINLFGGSSSSRRD